MLLEAVQDWDYEGKVHFIEQHRYYTGAP